MSCVSQGLLGDRGESFRRGETEMTDERKSLDDFCVFTDCSSIKTIIMVDNKNK